MNKTRPCLTLEEILKLVRQDRAETDGTYNHFPTYRVRQDGHYLYYRHEHRYSTAWTIYRQEEA